MFEIGDVGIYTPLLRELTGLYGKYMPEDDMLDIKILIRKYFAEKYSYYHEPTFAEIGQVREDFNEWGHDPEK